MLRVASRAGRIAQVLLRLRLDAVPEEVLGAEHLPRWARWLPNRLLPRPAQPAPRRVRLAIESLGPVFIKFGQILSTRRDLLSPEFADELSRLQDRVPPFDAQRARELIAASLDAPVDAVFARFDIEPLAAASIAQVHSARLVSGDEVIVKVVRPDVETLIQHDLQLLHWLAARLHRWLPEARRLRLPEVVADYERTILAELDLEAEAANTQRLRLNFADSRLLYVPRLYTELSSRNVMVAERIHGIPVADVDRLRAAGTDLKLLAERGVETFFTQVFVHNFFHADMHPGNVFVDVTTPDDPRWIALDCAIMGTLEPRDQDYLARNLLAFFHRDYAEVARLHLESGWVPPQTDRAAFEAVIAELCEPIFSRPLKDISFGRFLLDLFSTARRFDMQVQPQLVLLQKTLLNIEGLGRQLYPDLDLWQTAAPFMERWMAERVGPAAALRRAADRAPEMLAMLPRLPDLVLDAEQGMQALQRDVAVLQARAQAAESARQRAVRRERVLWVIVVVTLLFALA